MFPLLTTTFNIRNEANTANLPGASALPPESAAGIFISGLLRAVFMIGALLVLLLLVQGAIEWISSGGDKGKVEKARERITQAIIGLIILVSALAIFTVIQNFLGVQVVRLMPAA